MSYSVQGVQKECDHVCSEVRGGGDRRSPERKCGYRGGVIRMVKFAIGVWMGCPVVQMRLDHCVENFGCRYGVGRSQ